MNEKVVTVKNLQVTLDVAGQPLYATRGIDFDLYQGETLAIVGESGSGKSIAMHTLMGLLPAKSQVSADCLQVFDRDILSLSKKELQQVRGRQIGLISQDALSALNPTMRVETKFWKQQLPINISIKMTQRRKSMSSYLLLVLQSQKLPIVSIHMNFQEDNCKE